MHFRVCLHDSNVQKTNVFYVFLYYVLYYCFFPMYPFTWIPEKVTKSLYYACQANSWCCQFVKKHKAPAHRCILQVLMQTYRLCMSSQFNEFFFTNFASGQKLTTSKPFRHLNLYLLSSLCDRVKAFTPFEEVYIIVVFLHIKLTEYSILIKKEKHTHKAALKIFNSIKRSITWDFEHSCSIKIKIKTN